MAVATLCFPTYGLQPPDNIVSKKELPIKGINLVRTEQGNTYFISKDGRYIFQGRLYDVWNGEEIDSAKELERFSDRVDLDHLGVRKEKLFSLNLGSGEKEVHVFVDPRCHHCRELVKHIRDSGELRESYVFRVVISPISSKQSRNRARKLRQVAQRNATRALDAFVDNTDPDIELKDKSYPELEYNILLAKALSIESVPFLVSPDGRIRTGRPEDLAAFLRPEKGDQKE
ncbi:MAG: hypothetical protein K9K39_07250 [Desulfohalobiaceae bacterium]|nr:hypothetical protein [Desulfohalobiaceae bacterium]